MRQHRRSRTDYPPGVLAIYDNGGKTADRYTVVYEPHERTAGHRAQGAYVFPVTDMSGEPLHPQGVCQHSQWERRITGRWGYDKVIAFDALPADCQRVVRLDLQPASE